MDTVAHLLGDARRLAADGRIDQAKAAVDQAAKIIPGSSDIAQARVDIGQISTPQYRLADQLTRARMAIAQNDWPSAEAALQAAAGVDPNASEIAQLRQQMGEIRQKEEKRTGRIAELLGEMRQAIARRDLVAADRALNEAERLNIRDPAIDPARVELAHAQEDAARSRQQ
jgi:tetratricopeptide (TPR) repeat protein